MYAERCGAANAIGIKCVFSISGVSFFSLPHVYTLQFGHIAFLFVLSHGGVCLFVCTLVHNDFYKMQIKNSMLNTYAAHWISFVCNAAVRQQKQPIHVDGKIVCELVCIHTKIGKICLSSHEKVTPSSFTFRKPSLERAYIRINTDRDTLNGLFSVRVIRCCVRNMDVSVRFSVCS